MSRGRRGAQSALSRFVLRSAAYEGAHGVVWFAGSERRTPSIAPFFVGDDARAGANGFVVRHRLDKRINDVAEAGGTTILRLPGPDPAFAGLVRRAVAAPPLVDVTRDLPADVDTLRADLLTSTTREDLRRIRRANFTYRITTDPGAIREFHARHYVPLVNQRFPDDGLMRSLEHMQRDLDRGGELICADIEGKWVAGISNTTTEERYELQNLGIRDADESIRQKRVTAALLIRSLERAVEVRKGSVSLGRSLPFLGKGPVWFKAKWGGVVSRAHVPGNLHVFMDLRHASARRMLAESPIIQRLGGDDIGASIWLDPGDDPLRVIARDTRRFPGILRWHVLGEPETLAAAGPVLSANERVMTIPLVPRGDKPLWLGEAVPKPGILT